MIFAIYKKILTFFIFVVNKMTSGGSNNSVDLRDFSSVETIDRHLVDDTLVKSPSSNMKNCLDVSELEAREHPALRG